MKKGTRVTTMLDGKEVAARFVNHVTQTASFIQLFGEFRSGPTDDGYRTVETDKLEVSSVQTAPVTA
jgi:hypothetical protein